MIYLGHDVFDEQAVLRIVEGTPFEERYGTGACQGQGRAQFVRGVGHKGARRGERGGDGMHTHGPTGQRWAS